MISKNKRKVRKDAKNKKANVKQENDEEVGQVKDRGYQETPKHGLVDNEAQTNENDAVNKQGSFSKVFSVILLSIVIALALFSWQ